jgi:hypothetical protein
MHCLLEALSRTPHPILKFITKLIIQRNRRPHDAAS